ncbi:penicillin-binding protein 2A [Paenibacillus sp. UNCCL117]|uniref:transglycosylase domain-containing protein n=1 Tax=unclassified Paenibacillus TaxID=185978 RepID=UPI00088878E2|nr:MULTISPECIES: PBP1A family penicillin-binding protein [unclassified Paenibacillus]SDE18503.1 penicillin-binding protein 2A [Paenibacillus sp. cl123]SFW62200.1 penicillin-binding protein 2A [Paenibacillus sp. UNCCL117]
MESVSGQTPNWRKKAVVTLKLFLGLFVLAFVVSGLWGLNWTWKTYKSMYAASDITRLDQEPARSTYFYDRNGQIITEVTNARMEYTPLDQYPKQMLDAVIAVEDARFYEHRGIDIYGIARAFYKNWKSGHTVEGGSTITQQLAKTMLLSTEQTYTRKIKEAIAAFKIENTYSKDQILEMYLNYIYFGEGAWGLQRASRTYFGKNASELTLAESALMAGIPKSPTYYSPVKKPGPAVERRNLILTLMAQQGKITPQQRDEAMKEELKLVDKSETKTAKIYPSYIDHVINEAIEKYGLSEQQILSSGFHIFTNLDPKVQQAAETVYREPSFFPEDRGGLQSAIVLMEPQTGAIRGIVGSRNQEQQTFRAFNYATQAERQPGSTIKPLVVYAPALSQGFGPADRIYDEETDFGGGYKPMNYGMKFHGWVTMEEALIQSYNIPAVAMLKEIGIDKGLDFARKVGLSVQPSDRVFSIALGGMTKGTSPLQMAQAYTAFANNGMMAKAYAITKITDKNGSLVGEEAKPQLQRVLDPSVAYTMTKMLEKVVTSGTGQAARMDRPVAGKTGTTQLPDIPEFKDARGNQIDGSKDAWFVGYTHELVAAVWLGYERTNKEKYLNTTGGKYPAALFREVVSRALEGTPAQAFVKPESYKAFAGGSKLINGTEEALYALAEAKRQAARAKEEAAAAARQAEAAALLAAAQQQNAASQEKAGQPSGAEGAEDNKQAAEDKDRQAGADKGTAPGKPGAGSVNSAGSGGSKEQEKGESKEKEAEKKDGAKKDAEKKDAEKKSGEKERGEDKGKESEKGTSSAAGGKVEGDKPAAGVDDGKQAGEPGGEETAQRL